MNDTSLHPLDRATRLRQNSDGSLTGHTDPSYAHAVGPFGCITAEPCSTPRSHTQRTWVIPLR